jgi:hypothetical protein
MILTLRTTRMMTIRLSKTEEKARPTCQQMRRRRTSPAIGSDPHSGPMLRWMVTIGMRTWRTAHLQSLTIRRQDGAGGSCDTNPWPGNYGHQRNLSPPPPPPPPPPSSCVLRVECNGLTTAAGFVLFCFVLFSFVRRLINELDDDDSKPSLSASPERVQLPLLLGQDTSGDLRLKNEHERPLCFRIQSTNPTRHYITPCAGKKDASLAVAARRAATA